MSIVQLNRPRPSPSLFTERISVVRKSRDEYRTAKLHNHKQMVERRKKLSDACSHIKNEKLNRQKGVAKKIEAEIKLIQCQIEEQQHQKSSIMKDISKCQDEIANDKLCLFKVHDNISKTRSRCSHLQDVSHEMEEELKNKWTALMKSYNYFKQRLQCYMQAADPPGTSCYIYFFTTVKTDKYFVRVTHKDGKWSFSELTPELSQQNSLAQKLAETNDITGLLSCLVKLFQEQSSKGTKRAQHIKPAISVAQV